MVAVVLFWLSVLAIVHSYVVYPLLLQVLVKLTGKSWRPVMYPEAELPVVHVLIAAYNEEGVIGNTLEALLLSDYPKDKLKIYVGSDNSTDNTNDIIRIFREEHDGVEVRIFTGRTGKIRIINTLYDDLQAGPDDLLLLLDANIMLQSDTLRKLVNGFSDPKVGLVAGNILNSGARKDGISIHEKTYITGENKLKFNEGILWGTMMGAFGACYAVKAGLYTKVPPHHKVDDFFVTLKVLAKGYKAVMAPDAIAYEDVSNDIWEEFRRKVRIATGNFQNLWALAGLLWPPYKPLGFSFLSHKVLRWKGPFFLITAYLCNLWLFNTNDFYKWMFLLQNLLLIVPVIEILFQRLGLHLVPLRFVTYFYSMNAALLLGFFNYLKGDSENVWEPTKRNQ